ncbi:MAG TPA: Uma2 family endonuclease [Polyangiaceae bacterium]|nr:Uma2 family endonuclease [Polyangiaceae bacterium]HMR78787.1 Uma2 family endonuclease [Polyangiaceae bacterium]
MTSPGSRHCYTFSEYLQYEEASNTKHEFLDGEIYRMAGGTPEHAAVSVAMSALLFQAVRGTDRRAYSSDLRIRVAATGLTTYPDVTVVCGPIETDPENQNTVTNPKIVVEVLSKSTAAYDRREKLDHYKKMPSLQCCVLVDPATRSVETWIRAGGDWKREEFAAGDTMTLPELAVKIPIDSIFA